MPSHTQPVVGDTYAVRLGDGRHCVVRVIQVMDGSSLVVLTPWLDEAVPSIEELVLRDVLREHRYRYTGTWAASWYDGRPPASFLHLGRITPSDDESTHDANGRYSGTWHRAMVNAVVWELDPDAEDAAITSASAEDSAPEAGVQGHMDEARFWALIAQLDYAAGVAKNEARLIEQLIVLDEAQIAGFEARMTERLHALDTEAHAREIGAGSYREDAHFSVDGFLYARCAVVARGEEAYTRTLSDPSAMPNDEEYESLLALAARAYRMKTGRRPVFAGILSYETFANAAGWSASTS